MKKEKEGFQINQLKWAEILMQEVESQQVEMNSSSSSACHFVFLETTKNNGKTKGVMYDCMYN